MSSDVCQNLVALQFTSILKAVINDALDVCFQENDAVLKVRHFTFPHYFQWNCRNDSNAGKQGIIVHSPLLVDLSAPYDDYFMREPHNFSKISRNSRRSKFFVANHYRRMVLSPLPRRLVFPLSESLLNVVIQVLKQKPKREKALRELTFVSAAFQCWWNVPSFVKFLEQVLSNTDEQCDTFSRLEPIISELTRSRNPGISTKPLTLRSEYEKTQEVLSDDLTDVCQLISWSLKNPFIMFREHPAFFSVVTSNVKKRTKHSLETKKAVNKKRSWISCDPCDVFELPERTRLSKKCKLLSDTSQIVTTELSRLPRSSSIGQYKLSRKLETVVNPIFHFI